MNRFFIPSALLLLSYAYLVADPATQISAGKTYSDRGALSIALTYEIDHHHDIRTLHVSVKNIGRTSIFTTLGTPSPVPFQVFYENDIGVLIPLRDYSEKPGSLPTVVEQSFMPSVINAGGLVSGSIDLTDNEMKSIKGRLVVCKVFVSDHEAGEYKLIESSRELLVHSK